MTGIKESIWDSLSKIFTRYVNIDEVVLFGSRAKGTFKNGSDIDICLKGVDISTDTVIELMRAFDDLDLPYSFDLLIFDKISNDDLKDHIDRVGIVVYKKYESA